MIVYQTDPEGVYVGTTTADESPLEPGVFLLPGGCVEAEPPILYEKELARWNWEDMMWGIEEIPEPELPPGFLAVWEDGAWRAHEVPRLPEIQGLETFWQNGAWSYRRKPEPPPIPPQPEITEDQIAILVDGVWQVYDVAPADDAAGTGTVENP